MARQVLSAAQRAQQQAQRAAAERGAPVVGFAPALVTDVDPGGAPGGGDLVTVDWRGTPVRLPYIDTYLPLVNDVVAVAISGTQLLILGRITGAP